jgi:CheY-like chemotaxis protein
VLVVDDNRDAAHSMCRLLETYGCATRVAYGGPSALREAKEYRPDAVLCDLGLPGLSGYEVARQLREDREDLRLIAVSGYARPRDVEDARRAGFDAHLRKPADASAIREALTTPLPGGE